MRLFTATCLFLLCTACAGQRTTPIIPASDPGGVVLAALQTPPGTDEPTATALVATETATLLNTPELPTPESLLPLLETWTGQPTYLDESQPGYDFQVEYDILRWAQVENEGGFPALVHRKIPYCQVTTTAGRGLPRGWTITSTFQTIGTLQFEVVTASQGEQVQFINYFGRAEAVVTGFQVSFLEEETACRQAAEKIFATLRSVPAATPTASPTVEPTPAATP